MLLKLNIMLQIFSAPLLRILFAYTSSCQRSLWMPPYLKLVFLDELQLKIFYRPQQNLASNSKELSQLFSAGLCEKGRSVEVPQLHEYIWKWKREIRYTYTSVMRVGSDTFGGPIFQKGLQN